MALLSTAMVVLWLYWPRSGIVRWPPSPTRLRLTLPYGMAPPAFEAFVRACYRAKIQPWRIGQTIGEHPLSAGYHHKDGVLKWHGDSFDYCAAVDIGTSDLSTTQINGFLEELAKQGFAAFYRHGGKWQGREHIHAIYALLPMKIQLHRQVQEFLRERHRKRMPPLKWEKKWRRFVERRKAHESQ